MNSWFLINCKCVVNTIFTPGNIIRGNKTAGILITDHHNAPNTTIDPESDPSPDGVKILNNLGQEIKVDTSNEGNRLLINTNSLLPGIYFIEVSNYGAKKTEKFIKE